MKKPKKFISILLCIVTISTVISYALISPQGVSAKSYTLKAPVISKLIPQQTAIRIEWQSVSNAKYYVVQYQKSNGQWVAAGSKGHKIIPAIKHPYMLANNPKNGQTYAYRVCCTDVNGHPTSNFSTPRRTIWFKAPEISSVKFDINQFKTILCWNDNNTANHTYHVYYSTSSPSISTWSSWKYLGQTVGNRYTHDIKTKNNSLKVGTRYRYFVCAVYPELTYGQNYISSYIEGYANKRNITSVIKFDRDKFISLLKKSAITGENGAASQHYMGLNHSHTIPNQFDWCAGYVGKMLKYNVYNDLARKELGFDTCCDNWAIKAKKRGIYITSNTNYKPGDIVFIWRNYSEGHVGFVVKDNKNGTVEVISGNTISWDASKSQVSQRTYKKNINNRTNESIYGYISMKNYFGKENELS